MLKVLVVAIGLGLQMRPRMGETLSLIFEITMVLSLRF